MRVAYLFPCVCVCVAAEVILAKDIGRSVEDGDTGDSPPYGTYSRAIVESVAETLSPLCIDTVFESEFRLDAYIQHARPKV